MTMRRLCTAQAEAALQSSAHPGKNFWMTEVANIWDALPEIAQGAALLSGMATTAYTTMRFTTAGGQPRRMMPAMAPLLDYDTNTGIYAPRKTFYEHYSSFVLLNRGHVESPRQCRMLTLAS